MGTSTQEVSTTGTGLSSGAISSSPMGMAFGTAKLHPLTDLERIGLALTALDRAALSRAASLQSPSKGTRLAPRAADSRRFAPLAADATVRPLKGVVFDLLPPTSDRHSFPDPKDSPCRSVPDTRSCHERPFRGGSLNPYQQSRLRGVQPASHARGGSVPDRPGFRLALVTVSGSAASRSAMAGTRSIGPTGCSARGRRPSARQGTLCGRLRLPEYLRPNGRSSSRCPRPGSEALGRGQRAAGIPSRGGSTGRRSSGMGPLRQQGCQRRPAALHAPWPNTACGGLRFAALARR